MKTAFLMGIVLLFAAIWANAGELDKEVNAFQVELMSEKAYLAKMKKSQKAKKVKKPSVISQKTKARKSVIAQKTKKVAPKASTVTYYEEDKIELKTENTAPAINSSASISYVARPEIISTEKSFFLRATALPQFMLSAFDGADDSFVSPRGLGDSMKNGFAGNVTMDMNLFKDSQFVLEAGVSYLTLGAKTGIKQNNNLNLNQGFINPTSNTQNLITYEDDVKSQYLGVVLAVKWLASGLDTSTFYARVGALPMFLMDKQTSQGFGYYPYTPFYGNQLPQNNESRFGGINSFDIAAQVGLGYSLKLSSDFNVIADITGTQGFLPVMGNYNVYNAAVAAGLGISYKL